MGCHRRAGGIAGAENWTDHGLLCPGRRSARGRNGWTRRRGSSGAWLCQRRTGLPAGDRSGLPSPPAKWRWIPPAPATFRSIAYTLVRRLARWQSLIDLWRRERYRLGHRHRTLRSGCRRALPEYARHRYLGLCGAAGSTVQRRTVAHDCDRGWWKRNRHGISASCFDWAARSAG